MKAAKTQSSIESKANGATQAESKATLPVIPSSATDVELNIEPKEIASKDVKPKEDELKESSSGQPGTASIREQLEQQMAQLIRSYGKNDHHAIWSFHVQVESLYGQIVKPMLRENPSEQIKPVSEQIRHLLSDLCYCVQPSEYDYEQERITPISVEAIAGFVVDEILHRVGLRYGNLQTGWDLDNCRPAFARLFNQISQALCQSNPETRQLHQSSKLICELYEVFSRSYDRDQTLERITELMNQAA